MEPGMYPPSQHQGFLLLADAEDELPGDMDSRDGGGAGDGQLDALLLSGVWPREKETQTDRHIIRMFFPFYGH